MKGRVKRRLPLQVPQVKKRRKKKVMMMIDEDNQPSTSSFEDEKTI
jgi:hypothetical protein